VKRYGATCYFPIVNTVPSHTDADPATVLRLRPGGRTACVRMEVATPAGQDLMFLEYAVNAVVRQVQQQIKEDADE
jgi:hypothetical protein